MIFLFDFLLKYFQNDQLAKFIEEFHIPLARESYEESDITDDRKCIYLSRAVGLQPKG